MKLKKSKLWNKLFNQAIPFFVFIYMALTVLWISAEYVLAFINHTPVGELTVTLANGVVVSIITLAASSGFDHWLQDHYKVDNDGNPIKDEERVADKEMMAEDSFEVEVEDGSKE